MFSRIFLTIALLFWSATAATAQSCVCVACLLNPALENFQAASEAMAPTLMPGQCALMNHVDPQATDFERGDVIGFRHPQNGPVFIFRIAAIEGDRIAMQGGQVILNGTPIQQTFIARDEITFPERPPFPQCINRAAPGEICARGRYRVQLPSGRGYDIYDLGPHAIDDTPEYTVPEGHVFVLGDHRDNAGDSRLPQSSRGPGMVPLDQILGIFEGL